MGALYDRIGTGYTKVRAEDPRIAAAIHAALGDARTVVNVGAGAGSYEPRDRSVTAVEPSGLMIGQRPPGAARVVQASAEALPFTDGSFDAAMTVLSHHHWTDQVGGLREMRRVARRTVNFMWDPACSLGWLVDDYLTSFQPTGLTAAEVAGILGARNVDPVPIPHDCRDGFLSAYWRRPDAYLDPEVRAGISVFRLLAPEDVDDAMTRLARDLDSGEWHRRHADLLQLEEWDLGYRLVY